VNTHSEEGRRIMTKTTTIALTMLLAFSQPAAAVPPRAKQFLIYFVSAYDMCTAPDATHQPPLTFPACTPVASSTALTFGPRGYGYLKARSSYRQSHGTADAKLFAKFTDVRDTSGPFNGTLNVNVTLRVTDNLCTGPGSACTLPDIQMIIPVPCGTSAPTFTSPGRCALETTFNALAPGSLGVGNGTVISIAQLWVEGLATRAFEGGLFLP
jgi:hypothetical protein